MLRVASMYRQDIFSCNEHPYYSVFFFFFNDPSTTEIYTLSLHDALPICLAEWHPGGLFGDVPRNLRRVPARDPVRSEEHTSELQSQFHLVCRLLLEKKKNDNNDVLSLVVVAELASHWLGMLILVTDADAL